MSELHVSFRNHSYQNNSQRGAADKWRLCQTRRWMGQLHRLQVIRRPCFTPVFVTSFSFSGPYQFSPFLNLRFPIFGLTLFDWLRSTIPPPYFEWKYHFYFRLFYLRLLFQRQNMGVKQGLGAYNTIDCKAYLASNGMNDRVRWTWKECGGSCRRDYAFAWRMQN